MSITIPTTERIRGRFKLKYLPESSAYKGIKREGLFRTTYISIHENIARTNRNRIVFLTDGAILEEETKCKKKTT